MLDNILSKVVYVADGTQKQWDVPFEFYKIEDVHIYTTSDGEHIEEIDQNYYYDEEGKFFVYPTEESKLDPIPAGTQVLILRETENTQLEDSSEIYFKSKDIERGLDNLTMQVQDLKRDSLRAVKLSHFATQTPEDFTKGIFEAEKRATEAAARAATSESNASLSEQNAASSESSAVSASASAIAAAGLAGSHADSSLRNAERAEQAAADSDMHASNAAESANTAATLLQEVSNSIYNKDQVDAKIGGLQEGIDAVESNIDNKQDKLVAGSNITINGNVISATGGGGGGEGGGGGDGYSKEEIDYKFKEVDTAILGNTEAIQKTRSDFMESDNELQQQINSHATEITTLKNDTDELGDQVAEIESKIPEGTSDTNHLVNKQQLSDAIQSGVSVPDNVYTEDNLKGGKDIEIVKKSGGIDENTIACWHFDTVNDEVSGLPAGPFAGENNLLSDYVKFGEKSFNGGFTNTSLSFNSNESFSFDFWAHIGIPGSSSYASTGYCGLAGNTNIFYVYGIAGNKMDVFLHGTTTTTDFVTPRAEWFHIYGGYDHETKTYSAFANGQRIFSQVNNTSFTSSFFSISYQGSGVRRYDEVRVSKCVRWTEDFTPPTAPYEAGSAGSVINFIGQSGKNIGEVYYSQSSLASDNAGALPLFTGETIASANTIYPDFYAWVEKHTELQTTAEEYETALTTYGECPKYVVSNGSLRLPKLANYIKMANTTDGITQSEAGLPNITGQTNFAPNAGMRNDAQPRGAFYKATATGHIMSFNQASGNDLGFDASLSNPIYGNSDTVTTAHTTLYPWVFAYNATAPASTAQAAEFQNALSGKVDLAIGVDNSSVDYVVESYSDDSGNWYRVYKSGWIEQGGNKYVGAWTTITLLKPMATDKYTITTASQIPTSENPGTKVSEPTTTSFQIAMKWDAGQYKAYIVHWIVTGQGA